jgi:putative ABC transport system permease protein
MILGIILPLIATTIPVWRAVRVQPIDAIKTGHLVAKGGGFSKVKLPGNSFVQMPVRNLLRAPWRTLFTMLGVSMSVLLLVTFSGFSDSMIGTINQGKDAYLYESPDRVMVGLDFFYPADDMVEVMRGLSTVEDAQAALMLGGTLNDDLTVLLEFYDMEKAAWRPELLEGQLMGGIVISQKAADDLGVAIGDTVALRHPQRQGVFSFTFVETPITVVGIHNNPIRAFSYMDMSEAESLLGVADVTNMMILIPNDGLIALKQQVFQQSGVTSVQSMREVAEGYDSILEIFVVMFVFLNAIVFVIAFLLAFNTTSINVDERVREIATMFAFGLPVRTATFMQMLENFIIGIGSIILGSILGWWVLQQMLIARLEEQLADLQMLVSVSPQTVVSIIVIGLLAVTITPIFSIRKMRRMDIPSQLRVME